MKFPRMSLALATAATLALSIAPTLPAQADTPFGLGGHEQLALSFDGALTDSSPNATPVSMFTGAATWTDGVDGQALSLDGSSAVGLGTGAHLQPADLTVSFWYKPEAAMTGEQVFAWNKTVYNSEGWYLTAENATTPLALSIGASTGQPYKVAVEGSRDAFFPVGQWTHVVATYDHTTKAVTFYRNGVRQDAVVKYGVSASAPGTINAEATSTKTIGWNGPTYRGAFLKGALDEYRIYDRAATLDDVVTLTSEFDPTFDPAAIARADVDSLSLPATLTRNLTLPAQGGSGSTLTWATSDDTVIDIVDGVAVVTRPADGDATVRLTATATYGSSAPATRAFDVLVPQAGTSASRYVSALPLEAVTIEDEYLANSRELTVDYLLSLEPEKFLHGFYTTAGLTPTAPAYGGWERTSGTRFQGHFFGHYLTSLAQAWATETDPDTKAQLLAKLTVSVDGLKSTQSAYAAIDPANAGYVSPFSVNLLPSGGSGLLVPFYNLHKVEAGLIDVYRYAPEALGQEALEVASGFGTWVKNWASRQGDPTSILRTEYGGMNEALYNLYEITADPDHKRAAEYFDEVVLFRKLAAGDDVLNGLHANTTIPKLTGALKRYELFMDNADLYDQLTLAEQGDLDMYRAAAENFWQMVIDDHTYANGANSQSEHFHEPDTLHQHATNGSTSGYGENSTAEGCNEYNMLKLSRLLFQLTKDRKYADYYESTLINSVLASQNPVTGMMTYFQPMTAGYAKVFGRPFDEFWCDHGTAIESYTKLGDSIYFEDAQAIYVNQFRSSTVSSTRHDVTLTTTADVPTTDTVTIQVAALADGASETILKLRIPDWAATTPVLTVNGEARDLAEADGYATVAVSAGDTLTWRLTAEVTVSGSEDPDWVAFKYGPVLLATELSRSNVGADYIAGVLVRMSSADKSLSNEVTVADSQAWQDDIASNLVRLEDGVNANGLTTMRFQLRGVDDASAALVFEPYYSLYDARYAIYMSLIEPDSAASQAKIRRAKEQQRIEETTIDSLISFDDNNSEADKNYRHNLSSVGVWLGQPYRDGQRNAQAFFSYDMIIDPDQGTNYLGVRYFGGDAGRTFDVYLNDVLLKHEVVDNQAGSNTFYVQYDEIPQTVLDQIEARDSYKRNQNGDYVLDASGERIPVVTVRFQGNGTSYVGGVFGVYTTTSTAYDTDAELSALSFDGATLSPAFTSGVRFFELTVPADATAVSMHVDPHTPSGLVMVGDVLIDDRQPRDIPLTGDGQKITLTAYAQDHTTSATYTVTVRHADSAPRIEVDATTRCVAGKAYLVVRAKNLTDEPLGIGYDSVAGRATLAAAPGAWGSKALNSRVADLPAGSVTFTLDDESVEATYPATTCV